MKLALTILLLATTMIACGDSVILIEKDAPSVASEVSFEGYYTLPDGGYIDIYEDAQGEFSVRTARLMYKNADGSSALLPFASNGAVSVANDSLYLSLTVTITPATHNIKNDANNAQLTGSSLLQLTFSKTGEGMLSAHATVSQGPALLFNHTIVEGQ